MGEIILTSTSDSLQQVREAMGLPAEPPAADAPAAAAPAPPAIPPATAATATAPAPTPASDTAPIPPAAPADDTKTSATEAARQLSTRRRTLQTRIDQLTRKNSTTAAERDRFKAEADAARAELAALKGATAPAADAPPPTAADAAADDVGDVEDEEPETAAEPTKTAAPPPATVEDDVDEDPEPTFNAAEPREEDFEDWQTWQDKRAEFIADKKFHEKDHASWKRRQDKAAKVAEKKRLEIRQQAHQQLLTRVDAFRADHPDYDDVIHSVDAIPDFKPSPEQMYTFTQTDRGVEICYYLSKYRPDEMQRIAKLAPHDQFAELGELRALAKRGILFSDAAGDEPAAPSSAPPAAAAPPAPRVPVSKAAPMITTVTSGGTPAAKTLATVTSQEEYKKLRRGGVTR